jgi:hypothetical protein
MWPWETSKQQMSPLDVGSNAAFLEPSKTELGMALSIRDDSHEMHVIDLIDQGVRKLKMCTSCFEFNQRQSAVRSLCCS